MAEQYHRILQKHGTGKESHIPPEICEKLGVDAGDDIIYEVGPGDDVRLKTGNAVNKKGKGKTNDKKIKQKERKIVPPSIPCPECSQPTIWADDMLTCENCDERFIIKTLDLELEQEQQNKELEQQNQELEQQNRKLKHQNQKLEQQNQKLEGWVLDKQERRIEKLEVEAESLTLKDKESHKSKQNDEDESNWGLLGELVGATKEFLFGSENDDNGDDDLI